MHFTEKREIGLGQNQNLNAGLLTSESSSFFCGLHEEKREYEQEMGILPTLSLGLPPYAEPPAQEAGPPADLFLQSFRPITYWALSLILLALSGNSSLLLLLIMLKAKD